MLDLRALARAESYSVRDGRRVRLISAGGFDVEVLPDRGLDLGAVAFAGVPLAFCTPALWSPGPPGPNSFPRRFAAGLLTTCGLDHFGPPVVDGGQQLPQHGVATELVAVDVATGAGWTDEGYQVWVSGTMRQWRMFGENLTWNRRISVVLGRPNLRIDDEIGNAGAEPWPHMVLYHINFGYPFLDEGVRVEIPGAASPPFPRDAEAAAGLAEWDRMPAPMAGYAEQVFRHDLDPGGPAASATVRNETLGLAVSVRVDPAALPWIWQWTMAGYGTYALGIEPSNCPSLGGRAAARAEGVLPELSPGETRRYRIEISVHN